MPPRQRLSREAWTAAALEALAAGGVAAIAVEPLAAQLGATKGSFYWHFTDRDELVRAALALWEDEQTGAVIGELAALADPQRRLQVLLDLVLTHPDGVDPVVALFRDAAHPEVAAALRRVTKRRIDYVADELVAAGMRRAEAQRRAAMAVAAYIGWRQLNAVLPEVAPVGSRARKHAQVLRLLIEPPLP